MKVEMKRELLKSKPGVYKCEDQKQRRENKNVYCR